MLGTGLKKENLSIYPGFNPLAPEFIDTFIELYRKMWFYSDSLTYG